jgi:hypothetical protein
LKKFATPFVNPQAKTNTQNNKLKQRNNLQTPQNFHPSKSTMKFNLLLLSAAAMVNTATAEHTVILESAANYVILAETGISTVPTSNITGNIGVSPIAATAMTGFGLVLDSEGQFSTSSQVTGEAHAASYGLDVEAELTSAILDMHAAYTNASSRLSDPDDPRGLNLLGGLIGGETLTPGVYTFTTAITIDSDLIFNGGVHDIWIIKTTGVLTLGEDVEIILSGRAQAKNIFWQVAGGPIGAVIGEDASMSGIMLIKTSAVFKTGASLNGRILAQTRVDLQMATIMTVDEVFC